MRLYQAIENEYVNSDHYKRYLVKKVSSKDHDTILEYTGEDYHDEVRKYNLPKTLLIFLCFDNSSDFLRAEFEDYIRTLPTDTLITTINKKSSYSTEICHELAVRSITKCIPLQIELFDKEASYYKYVVECMMWCIDIGDMKQITYYMKEIYDYDEDMDIIPEIVSMCQYKEVYVWYFKYVGKKDRLESVMELISAVLIPNKSCVKMFEILRDYIDLGNVAVAIIEDNDRQMMDCEIIKYLFMVTDYKFDYNKLLKICKDKGDDIAEDIITKILDQI